MGHIIILMLEVLLPVEIEHKFMECFLQKPSILEALCLVCCLVHLETGPGVNWWVDIAEVELVCWQLRGYIDRLQ